jgi:hypothetical protein
MNISEIIDHMRRWMNTDTGIVIQYVFAVFSVVGISALSIVLYIVKTVKTNLHSIKVFALIALIIGVGVVFPILNLLLSSWHGWGNILLHILAIWGILSFLGLIYIVRSMSKIIKK